MPAKKKTPGLAIEQEYELVPIGGDVDILKEHPQNPNKGDMDAIAESVDANGWYGAITAQRSTGYILAGNHRYRTALQKGATEIPTLWRDVDDETAIRILLADNETARRGEIDEALLEQLLEGLETLEGTGYGLASAQEQIEAESGPEEASDDTDDPVPDDVYTPQYGIMVVCDSEEHQAETYAALQEKLPDHKFQVVAV